MALSYLKVVRVMGRGDLNHAGTEFHIHIGIRHDGDFPVHQGQQHLPADEGRISFILRIDRHSSITQHGFRELQELRSAGRAVFIYERVFDVPEVARLLLVNHLRIGNGGIAYRAPVYDTAAFIDPALFMHFAEHFGYGFIAAFVHGEALSVPVTGGAKLTELACDPAAVFLFPFPGALQEFFPSQVVLVNAFFL